MAFLEKRVIGELKEEYADILTDETVSLPEALSVIQAQIMADYPTLVVELKWNL